MDEDGSCQAKMGGNSLKGTDPNRPLMGERGRNDSPGNMSLRPSAFASKRAWDPGKWSSLPLARIWRIASHPSPKPGNYVDQYLWKISGFGPPISKRPASHKNQIKVRAQNRTCLYVRFWASFMFFPYNLCLRVICLIIFSLRFLSFAFCEFGSDGFRYEESPLPPTTTDLRRQQSASAATRELLREGSPKRRHQK